MRILFAILTLAYTMPAHAEASCSLMSEGIYRGYWMKHRIVMGEEVLFGANDMQTILVQLQSLRGQGLCQ